MEREDGEEIERRSALGLGLGMGAGDEFFEPFEQSSGNNAGDFADLTGISGPSRAQNAPMSSFGR